LRMLALDVGDRRIGLAVCDSAEALATPVATVEHTSHARDIETILAAAAERQAKRIVVGMPLSLSGDMGPQARKVARFVEKLAAETDIPVEAVDERYSTAEARRLMAEAGAGRPRERGRVDAAAAAVILQSYIDSRRSMTA
jgi:putative Holliday junction resolvase